MKAELEEVVRWDPHHAAAHLELAACYIKLFHGLQEDSINVMSLNQIRDAAISSRFSSRAALDQWLARAVGDHYTYLDRALDHTRRVLALCPLHGEGYLYLGELCFLEGVQLPAKRAYVAQALKVRPFDGAVLFHAGKEAWLEGDYEAWLRYWQRSFQCGLIYQRQVIDWLVGRTGQEELGEEIRFFLEAFNPDLPALRYLHRRYRDIAQPQQMLALRQAYADALQAEAEEAGSAEAADLWIESMAVSVEADDPDGALRCGREALALATNNFQVRRTLARCLAEQGQFAEAREHLNWCLKRKPGSASLERMLREVIKRQIEQDVRTVRGNNSPHYRR
jgi:tetratricopeptide (TPR) repeat protein